MRLTRLAAVAGASVVLVLAGSIVAPSVAFADSYPTWADVQKAKSSQATTQREVARVTGMLRNLTVRSNAARSAAADAGSTLQRSQDEFFRADQRYETLNGRASEASAAADVAASRAGLLAAQLYRTGGHNMSLTLVLSSRNGSESGPTALLDRLGSMSKLTASSSQLWAQARQAKNSAAAASAQAKSARDERGRLQREAQTALAKAAKASESAQQAVTAEQEHREELSAMLAALKDKTAKTVTAYQKGVQERAAEARRRQAEAERAAAAAERAAAVAAAERAARAGGGAAAVQPTMPAQQAVTGWATPVFGTITAGFGPRPAPCAGCSTWHEGVDIAAPSGRPIRAARSGTVAYAGVYGGYGNFILVDHGGGILTAYGHNIDGGIVVSIGQRVSAGQVIGHVGSTGNSTGAHLHFEVRRNGVQIDPILWMSQHGAAL